MQLYQETMLSGKSNHFDMLSSIDSNHIRLKKVLLKSGEQNKAVPSLILALSYLIYS